MIYPAQLTTYQLIGSGATSGDTTVTLNSFNDIDGNSLDMSAFGTIGFATIEPNNGSQEESITFTGITQNANGTVTLTGVNNIGFLYPFTVTSGLTKNHAGGVTFIVSNTSYFYYRMYGIKDNDLTITGSWLFPPPIDEDNAATKEYVDNLVNGGTVSTNRVVVVGVAGETVAAGQILYLKVADGRWYKASSAASATTDLLQLGVAQGAGTAGVNITGGVLITGTDTHQSGLAAGTLYYLSTNGGISSSAGTVERVIGQGKSTTELYFNPDFYYIPTGAQKAAFVGNATTAPSSTNTFVTQAGLNLLASDYSDGTATISVNTSLSRDMYYNVLTVNNGVTLNTAGYRIFCRILNNNGTISNNGGDGNIGAAAGGAAGTGGTAGAAGTLPGGRAGQTGGVGVGSGAPNAGANGTNSTFNLNSNAGSNGGGGGTGSGGSGGSGGTGGTNTSTINPPRNIVSAFYLFDFTSATAVQRYNVNSGSGAGGGGRGRADAGANGGSGGGSGGSAGTVFISAEIIVNAGTISANGGIGGGGGAGGGSDTGGGGGGAGGNGGAIFLIYSRITNTGTITANGGVGGTGGAGTGTGTNGVTGTTGVAGIVVQITT